MDILEEAKSLVDNDRQESYGTPKVCMTRTAQILSVLLNRLVSDREICLFNIAQKLARTVNTNKKDNWTDLVGYVYIMEEKL